MKTIINYIVVIIPFMTSSLFADNAKDIAIILKVKGTVKIQTANTKKWRMATKGMRLNSGDYINTGGNSLAAIMFMDDMRLIKIRENSTISIKGKCERSLIAKGLNFSLGQLWTKITKQKSDFCVEIPSGIAAIK